MKQMLTTIKKRWKLLTFKEQSVVLIVMILIVAGLSGAVYAGSQLSSSSSNPKAANTNQESNQQSSNGSGKKLPESSDRKEPITKKQQNISPLSGKQCERHNARPFASMLASGIGKAEVVIEMPVLTGSVTRLMGVFVCNKPSEVGSVRSARHDFISWARSFNAVFLHWGGSQMAKEELKTGRKFDGTQIGKHPHIDALSNQQPYFRKNHVPEPHNGVVSIPKAINAAKEQGIQVNNVDYQGFKFLKPNAIEKRKSGKQGSVHVGFAGDYQVRWDYNPETNRYSRYWGGQLATDHTTGDPVTTKNIIVFKAKSSNIQDDNGTTYNTLDMYGSGKAWVYKNGKKVKAEWEKLNERRPFKITKRGSDSEIKLTPGTTFIQVIEPYQKTRWETK